MEKSTIDMYLVTYSKYFESDKLVYLQEKLKNMPDEKFMTITALTADLKDPTTSLLLSIFLGPFGIDRFMIGDIGMGLLKLFTLGGCYILTIIDWFLIMDRTKEKNFEKIAQFLG